MRKEKNVRYHKIGALTNAKLTFPDSSSDEDEVELGRQLGQPHWGLTSRRRLRRPAPESRYCQVARSAFIAFTVIFTLAGLTAVVIYSSMMFPYLDNLHKVTDVRKSNNSFSNETTTNQTSGGVPVVTLTTNSPLDNSTTTIPHLPTTSSSGKEVDHPRKPETRPNRQSTQNEGLRGRPGFVVQNNFLDLWDQLDSTDLWGSDDTDVSQVLRAIEEDDQRNDMLLDDVDGFEAIDRFEVEATTTSTVVTEVTIPINRTTAERDSAQDETANRHTNVTLPIFPSNSTNASDSSGTTNSTSMDPKDQFNAWARSVWEKYQANDLLIIVSAMSLGVVMLICACVCCLIRRRHRLSAKRRHFRRLVSDLNESDKFTLVEPSDEEDDEDLSS